MGWLEGNVVGCFRNSFLNSWDIPISRITAECPAAVSDATRPEESPVSMARQGPLNFRPYAHLPDKVSRFPWISHNGGPQNHSTCVICLNDKSVKWMISGYIKFRKHPYGSGWFFASQNPSIDWHHMRFCDAIWVQIQAATIGLQISYPYNQATSYLCCKSLLAFAAPHLFTRAALEVFAQLCLDPVDPMIFSKGWAGHPAVYIGKIVSIDKCGIWYCVISFFTRVCY